MSDNDSDVSVDQLCRNCGKLFDDADGFSCNTCIHSFCSECLGKKLNFKTCEELGWNCTSRQKPTTFKFLSKGKLAQVQDKRPKRRGKGGGRRSVRRSTIKYFTKFRMDGVNFAEGDDVIVCVDEKKDKVDVVARIERIYMDTRKNQPRVKVSYFWNRDEAFNGGSASVDEVIELLFDGTSTDDLDVNSIGGIARIYSSSQMFAGRANDEMEFKPGGDFTQRSFWCTHRYHPNTKHTTLLNEGVLHGRNIIDLTQSDKSPEMIELEEEYHRLSDQLRVSWVPETLPCRENEHQMIKSFLKKSISKRDTTAGLYVHGMPGTGKTATVRKIVTELERSLSHRFDYIEINAMKLPTPSHAYTELYKRILGRTVSPTVAGRKLGEYFSSNSQDHIRVVLIDELDYMVSRQQKVIYSLFNWPLIVIGIANTMDLPERLLPRVLSRMSIKRVVFPTYTRQQLMKIISSRLDQLDSFATDAIRWCAASVAGLSGDCRMALQMSKRSLDLAFKRGCAKLREMEENQETPVRRRRRKKRNDESERLLYVTLKDMREAKNLSSDSSGGNVVQSCMKYEKWFLASMLLHNHRHQLVAASLRQYRRQFDMLCQTFLGMSFTVPELHVKSMVANLCELGLAKSTFNVRENETIVGIASQYIEGILFSLRHDSLLTRALQPIPLD